MIIPPANDLNTPEVLHYFGILYLKGEVFEQDYKKSAEYLEKASYLGDLDASYHLSIMYINGNGVEKNVAKAAD